jgi:hypothetical protein
MRFIGVGFLSRFDYGYASAQRESFGKEKSSEAEDG